MNKQRSFFNEQTVSRQAYYSGHLLFFTAVASGAELQTSRGAGTQPSKTANTSGGDVYGLMRELELVSEHLDPHTYK